MFKVLIGPTVSQTCTTGSTHPAEGISSGARKTAKIVGSVTSLETSQFMEETRHSDKVN